MVSDATAWRFALAERIAASYTRNPKTRVVMIAGSVGRGCADRYSDIEIDVYYAEPPTDAERIAAVEGCGGTVELLDQDEDEWEEQMSLGGFHAATSTFLVGTMERYLAEVVDRCEVAPSAQIRLSSLQQAVTVMGEEQVAQWRAKAAAYPAGLTHAMLARNLDFQRFWYAAEMLAARDDVLLLSHVFVDVQRKLLGALLGLNRIYLPTPDAMKWMDESIAAMAIKPVDLSARLKGAFRSAPEDGVRTMDEAIAETLALVERHAPEFDLAPYRGNGGHRRAAWDVPPDGVSLGA